MSRTIQTKLAQCAAAAFVFIRQTQARKLYTAWNASENLTPHFYHPLVCRYGRELGLLVVSRPNTQQLHRLLILHECLHCCDGGPPPGRTGCGQSALTQATGLLRFAKLVQRRSRMVDESDDRVHLVEDLCTRLRGRNKRKHRSKRVETQKCQTRHRAIPGSFYGGQCVRQGFMQKGDCST